MYIDGSLQAHPRTMFLCKDVFMQAFLEVTCCSASLKRVWTRGTVSTTLLNLII